MLHHLLLVDERTKFATSDACSIEFIQFVTRSCVAQTLANPVEVLVKIVRRGLLMYNSGSLQ